ncbi:MAG: tripartite tricarboxylate transporter substrate-binding protein [Burkholderiales bacterium]
MRRRAAALAGLLAATMAAAQAAYPERPLTLINPYPSNGTPDINGTPRITKLVKMMQTLSVPSLPDSLAQQTLQILQGSLRTTVKLERRPTGKTLNGVRDVAQADADGYTLLFTGNPALTNYPALGHKLPYDAGRGLAPVAPLAWMPMALIASTEHVAKDTQELIERARRRPGAVNYASPGDGSTAHLTGELFRRRAGIDVVHVAYNGSNPAMTAVITGQVEFGFVPLPAVLPYLENGKLRILGIASSRRHPVLPQTPTLAEAGLPDFEAEGWFGVFVPAGVDAAIVSLLNYEINRGLQDEATQRELLAQGLLPARASVEEFRTRIERERARWMELARTLPRGTPGS